MTGKRKNMLKVGPWMDLIISLLLSAPISATVYFWFFQPTNFISKRYIATAILLWIVLAALIFFLLWRIKEKISSIDRQVLVVAMLISLTSAFLLGFFVIGLENTPYNLFTLPKYDLVVENASENTSDVIELIGLHTGLGYENFSNLILVGEWVREENSLTLIGAEKASFQYEGWLVEELVLEFRAQPKGGRINIYLDGQLQQDSLYSPQQYKKQITRTIEDPLSNALSVLFLEVLAITIIQFPIIVILVKKNEYHPRSRKESEESTTWCNKTSRRTIASFLTIGACITFIGLIILLFYIIEIPSPDLVSIAKKYNYSAAFLKPEPEEHLIFTISTLVLPFLCTGFYLLFYSLLSKFKNRLKVFQLLITSTATVCAILITVAGLLNARIYLAASSLFQRPFLTVAFCAATLAAFLIFHKFIKGKRLSVYFLFENLYYFVGIILIVLIAMESVFNESEQLIQDGHFTAYFDSVVQVYLGKTLLINDSALYGLYALILKPIFLLIGLDVFRFTLIMGILKGMAFYCMLLLLRSATKNRWIAFMGFASIIFFTCLQDSLNLANDPYFQYIPHRLFFPAVFILLFWTYLREKKENRKKSLYFFISVFSSLSVLWNPDTGLVVLATWLICLVYSEMLLINNLKLEEIFINSLKHCVVVIVSIILILMIFSIYTYYSGGAWPNLSDLLAYPRLFYKDGLYLFPIKQIIHPWNLFVIIYITGVFIGARNFLESSHLVTHPTTLREGEKETNTLILAISILGIGLFYYYVGRSFDTNLIGTSWPVFLLLVIFTDRLFTDLIKVFKGHSKINALKTYLQSPQKYYKLFLFVISIISLTSSIMSIAINIPLYWEIIPTRKSGILDGMPDDLNDRIDFIKNNSYKGDQILILSNLAPVLYLYSNTPRPIPVPGFIEIVLQKDMEIINNFLKEPPMNAKIFWDPTFDMFQPDEFQNSINLCASSDGLLLFCKK